MKKLNAKEKREVENAKAEITHLHEKADDIYNTLIATIYQDNDWIYDYVFNTSVEDEYCKLVREKIFK